MGDSILGSVKALLGLIDDDAFDTEITVFINTALFTLYQLGIGPSSPYRIEGPTETWSSFLSDTDDLSMIKSYVYLRVRMLFDPPVSQALMTAIKEQIAEYEWRLNVEEDHSWEVE